jgi:hypothetical protein
MRELDAACARALGCRMVWFDRLTDFDGHWSQSGPFDDPSKCRHSAVAYWQDAAGRSNVTVDEFSPSTDPTAARELEDEIERRGLEDRYVQVLGAVVNANPYTDNESWALIRATPEQRARAFLEAVKE